MKWFKRWFQKMCAEAWQDAQNERKMAVEAQVPMPISKSPHSGRLGGRGMNGMTFTIYPANGGHVLEYNEWDPITDRNTQRLYIISSSQELGEGIAQVITMEHLKQ